MRNVKLDVKDRFVLVFLSVLCVGISVVLLVFCSKSNRESVEGVFQANVQDVENQIFKRMRLYEYGLRGVRGAVAVNGLNNLTRKGFLDYVSTRDFKAEFPGARGFGVVYRVPVSQVPEVEAILRKEYGPNKQMKLLSEHEGDRYVIRYFEPYEKNAVAVGLDIASEFNRKAAADASAQSGLTTLTAPLTILQAAANEGAAFLMMLPIHDASSKHVAGWAYAALLFNEVVGGVDFDSKHLAVRLSDVTDKAKPRVFFQTQAWGNSTHPLKTQVEFQEYGRTWRMEAQALPPIETILKPYNLAWVTVLSVLASMCAYLMVYLLLLNKQRSSMDAQLHQASLAASIIEAHSAGTLLVDVQGRIVRLNQKILEIFGYTKDELLGQTVEMLIPKHLREKHVETRSRISYDGSYFQMAGLREVYGLRADGSTFPVEVMLNTIEVNQEKYVMASVTDLTQRLEFLSKIQASESSWRGLTNALPQLIWGLNMQGRVDYLSEQWGFEDLEPAALEKRFFECFAPDDQLRVRGLIYQALQEKDSQQIECRLKRPLDADYEWYDLQLVPCDDEHGEVLKWIGSNTNIEFRKQIEAEMQAQNSQLEFTVQARTVELRKAQQNLADILNSVPTMIGYWNRHLSNEFANQSLKDFMEQARGVRVGEGDVNLFEQLFDIHSQHIQAALSGRHTRFEEQVWLLEDLPSYFDIHYIPHFNQGQVIGLYVLMQDITEVRKAQMDAELVSRQKSAFLAVMSHELRTPLNGILGLSSFLSEKIEDDELKQDAVFLRNNAQTLTVILNDILDISKVESGKLKLESIAFSLEEQLTSCCMLHQIPAQEKGLVFEAEYLGFDESTHIMGDPTRLRQVVHNLLSNAVKFTAKGKVSLRVEYVPSHTQLGLLRIAVSDTGVGIPVASQSGIFQPFFQGDSSTFRQFGGTGLGLSVTKVIVLAMGGKVWFNSEDNKGTTFFVEVPVQPALAEKGAHALPLDEGGEKKSLTVLIVDDVPLNLKVLRKLLENDKHVVDQASDGLTAFDLCETKKYDLIFLDISMPGLDGYDVTRLIREKSSLNRNAPIVALSGHAFDEDVQKALDSGMNSHLSKPIDVDEMRQRVLELTA